MPRLPETIARHCTRHPVRSGAQAIGRRGGLGRIGGLLRPRGVAEVYSAKRKPGSYRRRPAWESSFRLKIQYQAVHGDQLSINEISNFRNSRLNPPLNGVETEWSQ